MLYCSNSSAGHTTPLEGATPLELRACISEQAFPPFNYPDREGLLQHLLRRAVEAQGLRIRFVIEPRARCLYNLDAGHYQWLPFATYTPSLIGIMVFPMRDGVLDLSRQLAATSAWFITPLHSSLRWDGARLTGQQGPLLYRRGSVSVQDWAKGLQLTAEPAQSGLLIANMLLAGRSNAAILSQSQIDDLRQHSPELIAQLRVLKPVAAKAAIFATTSKAYARDHAQQAEAIWDEMLRLQHSPEYLELQQQLERESLPAEPQT